MNTETIYDMTARLEKSTLQDILSWVNALEKAEPEQYHYFWYTFSENILRGILAEHKKSLAIFLAHQAKVEHLPEDRSRIVFSLAQLKDYTNINALNQRLAEEFGPHFKILEKYNMENRVISWKQVMLRAKEIYNGYYNHAAVSSLDFAEELMVYYNSNQITDPIKIDQILTSYLEINQMFVDRVVDDAVPSLSANADLLAKIKQFYKETNRLQADIDKLDSEINFSKIIDYLQTVKVVMMTRKTLIRGKIPINDREKARFIMLRHCSDFVFDSYLSAEELQRYRIPLKPVAVTKPDAILAAK